LFLLRQAASAAEPTEPGVHYQYETGLIKLTFGLTCCANDEDLHYVSGFKGVIGSEVLGFYTHQCFAQTALELFTIIVACPVWERTQQ